MKSHYCEGPHCENWGAFGFKNAKTTHWYCMAHMPVVEEYPLRVILREEKPTAQNVAAQSERS